MRWILLLAALQQALAPVFINPFADRASAAFRAATPSGIAPAGYAFAIWGPIYLGALGYAVWQLTVQGRADPVTARVVWPLLALYAGSTIWLACAKYGPLWATMPILALMAVCAAWALVMATGGAAAGNAQLPPGRWLALVLPLSLYAGWTCCAAFVNIAEVAPAYGFARFGLSPQSFGIAALVAAPLAAILILWLTRAPWPFALTIGWALVAIMAAAAGRAGGAPVLFTAAAGLVMLALAFALIRRGISPPPLAAR